MQKISMNATFSFPRGLRRCLSFFLARTISLVSLIGLLAIGIAPAAADHGDGVRIGVLHQRGPDVATQAWTPMIDHFSRRLPGTHFELVPLDYSKLGPAVEKREVDFIFTAAGQYVDLEVNYGVSRIATVKSTGPNGDFSEYGGVVVVRANQDIQKVEALRGKTLLIPDELSFGGWQMQRREFRAIGMEPGKDFKLARSGNNENTFIDLLDGKGDAATARSDVFERMVRDGKLKAEDFRLLRFAGAPADYPYWVSTRLYPEWPFAKLRHTPDALAERLLVALLDLPRNSPEAKSAEIVGFTVPKDYGAVHSLYRELELGPYAHQHVEWRDVLEHYRDVLLIVALLLVLAASSVAIFVVRSNRRLERENTERQRVEAALQREKVRSESYLEAIGSMIVIVDPNGLVMLANRRANEVLGYAEGELEGLDWFATVIPPDQRSLVQGGFERAMARQIRLAETYEHDVLTRDGRRLQIAWSNRTLTDAHGKICALIGAGEDVTERRAAEAEVRLFAKVFESSAEGVMICDGETRIERVNRAFSEITGFAPGEVIGINPRVLASGRQPAEFFRQMWRDIELAGRWQGEIWNRRKSGEVYPQWLSINTITNDDGETVKYVGIFTDLSQSKADQAQIHFLAYYDPLTSLPNRRLLGDRFDQSLAAARRNSRHLAVLFVDLDRFKQINDSLGHPIGDRVLEGVAERFKHCVRESDSLARVGGDEFVLMLPDVASPEDAAVVALKCFEALRAPFRIDDHELRVTPSIGIALCPQDGETLDALIKAAETAMYAAKDAGRATYRFFTGDMNARIFARMLLENQLRKATERREFVLHYQPQLDVGSGAVIGVEALIRWNHPDQGLVYPGYFITVAEETGLITEIGRWVLGEACRQMAAWHAAGLPKISVAVNVAAPQFHTADFYAHVTDALADSGLDPHHLELELTESILVQEVEATLLVLQRFKALGVMLSVDDFGTGYSSLSYLKRFPVDRLKIDQSFVRGLSDDKSDRAIVGSIIAMGKNLRLKVLAEGVETAEHLAILKGEGCDEYQGYLFSKPVPAEALPALMTR